MRSSVHQRADAARLPEVLIARRGAQFACREDPSHLYAARSAQSSAPAVPPSIAKAPARGGEQHHRGDGSHPIDRLLLEADRLALSLRSALERIAIPLTRAVSSFVRDSAWLTFGFARLGDHARERFGRSGRWVRDAAALGVALDSLPALAAALTGDDGGRPIGKVAALLIGQIASADSLGTWVALARIVSVRALREAVKRARSSASEWPLESEPTCVGPEAGALPPKGRNPASVAAFGNDALDDDDDPAEKSQVRIAVPLPIVAAFDETVDLYRAVEGSEASVTSFVEALVAEASAGEHPPEVNGPADAERAPLVPCLHSPAALESDLARATQNWRHLPPSSEASWALALAGTSLARLAQLSREAGRGGPARLDAQLRALIALENEIEGRLGRLLAGMGERGAWSRLRFAGVGHYAEQRLGVSRTSAEDRARVARSLDRFPLLRAAYEDGRIGLEVSLLILRILGPGPVDEGTEIAWVRRGEEATVKRLRDEARALARRAAEFPAEPDAHPADSPASRSTTTATRVAPPSPASRSPLDDAVWHAALRREPGTARARILRLGMIAAASSSMAASTATAVSTATTAGSATAAGAATTPPSPDVFLRLRLPDDLAAALLAAIESRRRSLTGLAEQVEWHEPWPDPQAPPSVLAARTFSIRCRRVPAWVGLLALLEEFVFTWDGEEQGRTRPGDAVYIRDGWRCTAPGCTSRRNLEDHHLVYRSRGGGDGLSNRACLCRFHHQRGEHGDLASCSGAAPLAIIWRLGRIEVAQWYRNERRLRAGGTAGGSDVVSSSRPSGT